MIVFIVYQGTHFVNVGAYSAVFQLLDLTVANEDMKGARE